MTRYVRCLVMYSPSLVLLAWGAATSEGAGRTGHIIFMLVLAFALAAQVRLGQIERRRRRPDR